MRQKFIIQNSQYVKPYHHLVAFDINNPKIYDCLIWGLEYYGYVSFILKLLSKVKFNKVAEVGCGDGKILLELAKKYPDKEFFGFDLSKEAIAFAKAFSYNFSNLSFFDTDFKDAENKYDVILCIETLEHIPDESIESFISTMYRNMNRNSTLIISVPTTNVILHRKHYRHYNSDLLKKQVSNKFDIIEKYYVHNSNWLYRLIRNIFINRFFITNMLTIRKMLFRLYNKKLQRANSKTGSHLIAVLRVK